MAEPSVDVFSQLLQTLAALGKCIRARLSAEQLPITPDQYALLDALIVHGALTQAELAELYDRDRSVVLRQTDHLEEERLVSRVADAEDRRKKTLGLTRQGRQVRDQAQVLTEAFMREVLGGLPPGDVETFQRVLRTMKDKAQELDL